MTHLVSVSNRGASQSTEAAPVVNLNTTIVRRQAALMPLKSTLTALFIEAMEISTSDNLTAQAVAINAKGMGANNEQDVQQAIIQLETLLHGFMPPMQQVA